MKLQVVQKDNKYYGKRYSKPLYKDSSGTTAEITFSEAITNFKFIEIFYTYSEWLLGDSIKIDTDVIRNNNAISLSVEYPATSNDYVRRCVTTYFIRNNATQLIPERITNYSISTSGVNIETANNKIKITKILGYYD